MQGRDGVVMTLNQIDDHGCGTNITTLWMCCSNTKERNAKIWM